MVNVFLYAPQDFRNLCVLARTLEVLGHRDCHVFDPWRLLRERYGKARSREMRVVSAGAFEKLRWHRVEEPEAFLATRGARVVATVADAGAEELTRFQFAADDWLLFGSESSGLPPSVVARAQAAVTIPSRGDTQSLNLAVSLGVILFEAQRQLGGARNVCRN
jgi:tRNA (cytidine/uridine-2'-O-)-methyltransferase